MTSRPRFADARMNPKNFTDAVLTLLAHGEADGLEKTLTPQTKLIALAHVSNTLGCLNPVSEVVALAKGVGARVLLDACRATGRDAPPPQARTARAGPWSP